MNPKFYIMIDEVLVPASGVQVSIENERVTLYAPDFNIRYEMNLEDWLEAVNQISVEQANGNNQR